MFILLKFSKFWRVWYHYQLFTLSFWPRGYTKVLPEIWEDHNLNESMSSSHVSLSLNSFKRGWKQQDCENWHSRLAGYVITSSAYSPALLRWQFQKKLLKWFDGHNEMNSWVVFLVDGSGCGLAEES